MQFRRMRLPLLLIAAFAATMTITPSTFAAAVIGQKAPDFSIPDAVTGDNVTLSSLIPTHKAVVLIFVSTQCPYSNGYNGRMQDLSIKYGDLGVDVIGINSNDNEEEADIVEHKWQHHLTFPILKDMHNIVADSYGASHTPEAYVVDGNGILVYHGRIDNSVDLPSVKTHELADALNDVLSGKPVAVPETKAFGCSIKRTNETF